MDAEDDTDAPYTDATEEEGATGGAPSQFQVPEKNKMIKINWIE